MGKFIDLTGMKFGRLTVIERAEDYVSPSGHHNIRWLCECDCNKSNPKRVVVTGMHLKGGTTMSCGCLRDEKLIERNISGAKTNDYEVQEDYVIMYTSKNEPFYVDLEDFWKVRDIYWHKDSQGYIVSKNGLRIHRIIMNCPKGLEVDHAHGKKSRHDNRKENLRIATHSENQMNQPVYSNNTSGATGVYKGKRGHGWYATISCGGKTVYLGQYDTFEEALKKRKDAEEKYFGNWSYNNSQNL